MLDFFRDLDIQNFYGDLSSAVYSWAYDFLRTNGQIQGWAAGVRCYANWAREGIGERDMSGWPPGPIQP